MRTKQMGLILIILTVAMFASVNAQSASQKQYLKEGISFDYEKGWEITEQAAPDKNQIALSEKATDSQILIVILKKKIDSKDPMPDLKKQVIDPWLSGLLANYKAAGVTVVRSAVSAIVGGQSAEGARLKFFLDDQAGGAEAFWTLVNKRLVLLYYIRPDKTAERSVAGWELVRTTLKVEAPAK